MTEPRRAEQHRATKETTIDLDARRRRHGRRVGVDRHPVLRPHARAARQARRLRPARSTATGDLEVDLHHTVEDVGIVLGTALKEALGDKAGVRRFAYALVPLDEALVQVALDLSGRPFLVYEVDPVVGVDRHVRPAARRGVLAARFVVRARGITLHIRSLVGQERPPRDRGVVQGRRPRAARRGADRGRRRAVAPRARSEPRRVRAATRRSTSATASASGCYQGDFDAETVYDDDPVAVARAVRGRRRASGSTSSTSTPPAPASRANLGQIEAIVRSGRRAGCRSAAACAGRGRAARCSTPGSTRVVVGTAAVERPELVDELCARASRARSRSGSTPAGSEVAVRGWVEGAGADLVELRRSASTTSGVAALVVTEIGRDGTLEGPTSTSSRAVLEAPPAPGDRERRGRHARRPARRSPALEAGGRRLAGAIVGRAIYEGRFTVAEALASLAEPWPTDAGRGTVDGDTQHHRRVPTTVTGGCAWRTGAT